MVSTLGPLFHHLIEQPAHTASRTLQELIAPHDVYFYDAKWRYHGQKRNLAPIIAQITGISSIVISSGRFRPNSYSVAERMSWASRRETTREEDLAYCLFGIFGVNLPLLYGEGSRAFIRLQEEIVKNTTDLTVFAWQEPTPGTKGLRGIFARSPSEFAHAKVGQASRSVDCREFLILRMTGHPLLAAYQPGIRDYESWPSHRSEAHPCWWTKESRYG